MFITTNDNLDIIFSQILIKRKAGCHTSLEVPKLLASHLIFNLHRSAALQHIRAFRMDFCTYGNCNKM